MERLETVSLRQKINLVFPGFKLLSTIPKPGLLGFDTSASEDEILEALLMDDDIIEVEKMKMKTMVIVAFADLHKAGTLSVRENFNVESYSVNEMSMIPK